MNVRLGPVEEREAGFQAVSDAHHEREVFAGAAEGEREGHLLLLGRVFFHLYLR